MLIKKPAGFLNPTGLYNFYSLTKVISSVK